MRENAESKMMSFTLVQFRFTQHEADGLVARAVDGGIFPPTRFHFPLWGRWRRGLWHTHSQTYMFAGASFLLIVTGWRLAGSRTIVVSETYSSPTGMKIRSLASSALMVAFSTFYDLRADEGYATIDITPQANFTINALKKSRTGHVVFRGVPFDMPKTKPALQTEGFQANGPTSFNIPVSVFHPTEVNVLLSGGFVKREYKGKKVGEVVLYFKDGKQLTYPITAWETLRETWAFNTEILQPGSTGNPKLINVYSEQENRGKAATAFLDMYVIHLEPAESEGELTAIEFKDLSRETVRDVSPSLIISGISIKHF